MAGLFDDLGGYTPEQAWRGRYRARRGGILDMLPDDESMPRNSEPAGMLSSVRSGANQALGLLDHYTMGIPSTAAGLINAAIPFQPLGDMMTSVRAGRDAADEFAANGRGARDLLSLPDAFAGHIGSSPHVPAGARLTAEGAAKAGRGIDNALSSAVRAMPENAVGSGGWRLPSAASEPPSIRAYHGNAGPAALLAAGAFAGGLSNDADRAELMLNRQSPRLYDYAPRPGMLDLMGSQ